MDATTEQEPTPNSQVDVEEEEKDLKQEPSDPSDQENKPEKRPEIPPRKRRTAQYENVGENTYEAIPAGVRYKRGSAISFDEMAAEFDAPNGPPDRHFQRSAPTYRQSRKQESDSGRDSSTVDDEGDLIGRGGRPYKEPDVIIRPSSEEHCNLELIAPVVKYINNTPVRMRPHPRRREYADSYDHRRVTVGEYPGFPQQDHRALRNVRHLSLHPIMDYEVDEYPSVMLRDVHSGAPAPIRHRNSYLAPEQVPVRQPATMAPQEPDYQSVPTLMNNPSEATRLLHEDVAREPPLSSDVQSGVTLSSPGALTPSIKIEALPKQRTALLILAFFAMGVCVELPDLLLHALSHHTDSTYEGVARVYAASGGAMLLGAVVTGTYARHCHGNVDYVMALSLAMAACSSLAVPWCTDYTYFLLDRLGSGMAFGILYIVGVLWLQRHWSVPRVHIIAHLIFIALALAGLVACLITAPFLLNTAAFQSFNDFLHDLGVVDDVTPPVHPNNTTWRPTDHIKVNRNETEADEYSVTTNSTSVIGRYVANEESNTREGLPSIIVPVFCAGSLCFLVAFILICTCFYTSVQSLRSRYQKSKLRKQRKKELKILASRNEGDGTLAGSRSASRGRPPSVIATDSGTWFTIDTREEQRMAEVNSLAHQLEAERERGRIAVPNRSDTSQEEEDLMIRFGSLRKRKARWFKEGQRFDVPLLSYLYVFFTFSQGLEVIYSKYLFPLVAQSTMQGDPRDVTHVMTVFWSAMTVGRIIMIPLSCRMSANSIMIHCLFFSVLSPVMMLTVGQSFPLVLWVFVGLAGLSLGPILPGGFTWAYKFLAYSSKAVTLAVVFAAFGRGLFSWLGGMLLDFFDQNALLYLTISTASSGLVLYIPVLLRFDKDKSRRNLSRQSGPLVSYV